MDPLQKIESYYPGGRCHPGRGEHPKLVQHPSTSTNAKRQAAALLRFRSLEA